MYPLQKPEAYAAPDVVVVDAEAPELAMRDVGLLSARDSDDHHVDLACQRDPPASISPVIVVPPAGTEDSCCAYLTVSDLSPGEGCTIARNRGAIATDL